MKLEETRRKLIEGAIRIIAREGLDRATTKMIGFETSTNEVYIYRCFSGKDDMFAQMFASLDYELLDVALQHISVMYDTDIEYKKRCRIYFSHIWRFLLDNRDKCLAFIRYYYSPYYVKFSAEDHKERFIPLLKRFENAFHKKANVWMILNHIMDTMLAFSVNVFNGFLPDNDDSEEHVFRLVYASTKQYFKEKEC